MKSLKAFTLIELLIVVAIIAILAAIAVPNFLEAQIRAKTSRVKSDMRSCATAIEAYAVDQNRYPRMHSTTYYGDQPVGNGILWVGLTSPVAYISTVGYIDPFQENVNGNPLDERRYTYQDIQTYIDKTGQTDPATQFWPAAKLFYGKWRMCSVGPDKKFDNNAPSVINSAQLVYDPTNGTVSSGNIFRSQFLPQDKEPPGLPLLGPH